MTARCSLLLAHFLTQCGLLSMTGNSAATQNGKVQENTNGRPSEKYVSAGSSLRSIDKEQGYRTFCYDLVVWILSGISSLINALLTGSNLMVVAFDLFFREIKTRGAFHIPRDGAVIFVAAPHANQVCREN